jgi:hypothetical protein
MFRRRRRRRRRRRSSEFGIWDSESYTREERFLTIRDQGGGEGGGGVYSESYTREARFLTRWDQHAVSNRQP